MNQRSTIAAVVAVAAILVGAVFAVELPAAPAHAGWGSWSGTSPAFNGGTITSGITFSGVTTDIATAGSEDLTLAPGGSIVLRSGDNIVDIQKSDGTVEGHIGTNTGTNFVDLASASTSGGIVQAQANGAIAGRQGAMSATTQTFCVADGMSDSTAGTMLGCYYGDGIQTINQKQSAACSAGTASIAVTSSTIDLDANAAACTVTFATTNLSTIALDSVPIRLTVTTSSGAGVVKFASTNFQATLPTKCTSTGITQGMSILIAWDAALAKWTYLGGCE